MTISTVIHITWALGECRHTCWDAMQKMQINRKCRMDTLLDTKDIINLLDHERKGFQCVLLAVFFTTVTQQTRTKILDGFS